MKKITRKAAVTTTAVLLAGLGVGGTVAAQAYSGQPAVVQQTSVEQSDGDGEVDPATEAADETEAVEENDGPDLGPDANPNEPGHQDADESGEAEGPEQEDGTEAVEENDGPDQGPDANPNEPGHQDADESGESE